MIHNLRPSLAEAGKIKIGRLSAEEKQSKAGGTWRPPEKLDHFVITGTSRGPDGMLIPDDALMAALPHDTDGKIREIPIVLHSDVIDEVFPTRYVRYEGRKLACHGDGEIATEMPAGKSRQCPCSALTTHRCKPSGILHCSIRVEGRAVAGAVHKWRTTSLISCQQMIGSLMQIRQTVGVIQAIPLVLRVGPVQVAPDGKPTTVYVCWVELRALDLSQVQATAMQLAQQREAVRMAITGEMGDGYQYRELVAPTPEEEQDTADEFYPPEDAPAEPEPVALPESKHEVREAPNKTVLRMGKSVGGTKAQITETVKRLQADGKVAAKSDEWTDDEINGILEEIKNMTKGNQP
jgi:hypothetical protein